MTFSALDNLEAEAIYVMREVAADFKRPVVLFSGGKDSLVLLRLAEKAFLPDPLPFTVLQVETGHDFPEALEFRDRRIAELEAQLVVASVAEAIEAGDLEEPEDGSRNRLQSPVLLEALREHGFDAAIGGARRDEERARAKERVMSFRDPTGGWRPEEQRPELWRLFNPLIAEGEHVRVFPLSNWTELDVWRYIRHEELELPSLYFAHERRVIDRDGILLAAAAHGGENGAGTELASVRYRTVGDMTVTGAVRSEAATVAEVLAEVAAATVSERGETRADDRSSVAAMEERKREGYF